MGVSNSSRGVDPDNFGCGSQLQGDQSGSASHVMSCLAHLHMDDRPLVSWDAPQ